jgi:hypothetical protein
LPIDTCQIKDHDHALIFQFITIHGLHPTYNPWIKHTNGVNIDNYRLTLVDLKILGHKNDPWVLADRVVQVFYVLDLENGKHIIVSRKQKIIGVDNVEDNDEKVNQFEEIPLFTNPINIKHIENDFDNNLLLYMRKAGK